MKTSIPFRVIIIAAFCVFPCNRVWSDTFGSGAHTFEIEFVRIGSPGNAPDTTGAPNPAGAVPYIFRMGKYEVSAQMLEEANQLGGLGISMIKLAPDQPAVGVDWFEAARFVNWLNTSTGHSPAYKFVESQFKLWTPDDAGYNSHNLYRNRLAKYVLPSDDEWYKAAYHDPQTGFYFDYATASNQRPDGKDGADDPDFEVVYMDTPAWYPYAVVHDIHNVGAPSPHGTNGQNGNVAEWLETEGDLSNDLLRHPGVGCGFFNCPDARGVRGGAFDRYEGVLWSSTRSSREPSTEEFFGFRVASIPEPGTIAFVAIGLISMASLRRRSVVPLS